MFITRTALVNALTVLSLESRSFKSVLGLFIAVNAFQSQYWKRNPHQLITLSLLFNLHLMYEIFPDEWQHFVLLEISPHYCFQRTFRLDSFRRNLLLNQPQRLQTPSSSAKGMRSICLLPTESAFCLWSLSGLGHMLQSPQHLHSLELMGQYHAMRCIQQRNGKIASCLKKKQPSSLITVTVASSGCISIRASPPTLIHLVKLSSCLHLPPKLKQTQAGFKVATLLSQSLKCGVTGLQYWCTQLYETVIIIAFFIFMEI